MNDQKIAHVSTEQDLIWELFPGCFQGSSKRKLTPLMLRPKYQIQPNHRNLVVPFSNTLARIQREVPTRFQAGQKSKRGQLVFLVFWQGLDRETGQPIREIQRSAQGRNSSRNITTDPGPPSLDPLGKNWLVLCLVQKLDFRGKLSDWAVGVPTA
jgi:hypothetical protein